MRKNRISNFGRFWLVEFVVLMSSFIFIVLLITDYSRTYGLPASATLA